jgi:hypothetical protein
MMGGGPVAIAEVANSTDSFSIHALSLKGILDTPNGPIALLVDSSNGVSYVLKAGRVLAGPKEKPLPGVTGVVRGKSVRLTTQEKDIQELRLGEEEE